MGKGSVGSRGAETSRRPIAIDLFSGAGGLSLGFEQAGFDLVASFDHDPVHVATHIYNFPSCEARCRDINQLSKEEVLAAAERGFKRQHPRKEWRGTIDAIVGGPPCQGFSAGGTREEDDSRNSLIGEFVRLVEQIQPRTFCLENVVGLMESRFAGLREGILRRLRIAGYAISGGDEILNCSDFGVPQIRRRILILGSRIGEAPAALVGAAEPVNVGDALAGLPDIEKYDELLSTDKVRLSQSHIRRRKSIASNYARQLSGLEPIPGDRSRARKWNTSFITGSRRTLHGEDTIARFDATIPGSVEQKSRLFRLSTTGLSRTLRAGTGPDRGSHTSPRPIHPEHNRVVTVREAARLHGYPDWFRFHTTNWHGHRQVGNSVPPPLARAAAQVLLESLDARPVALRSPMELGPASLLYLSRKEAEIILDHSRGYSRETSGQRKDEELLLTS